MSDRATSTSRQKFTTPEIPPEFVLDLRGKQYITANGLIYLAHLQGLRRVTVEHLKLPTAQDASAIVRCEVETDLGTFADYGEVSPASKGSVGGAYPLSLATTRARNRALRIATGCPLTSYEEIGADVLGGETDGSEALARGSAAADPALAAARATIGRLRDKLWSQYAETTDDVPADLTLEQAQAVIAALNARGRALREQAAQPPAVPETVGAHP